MTTIGFIGLGNMGKGMSINLSNSDLEVIGYDANFKTYEQLKMTNIKTVNDIKSVTEQSKILITMLPDGKIVEEVWMEIIKCSKPGQYIIDCSTIDVKTSIYTQKEAKNKKLFTLDAPVSGGVIGADNGTLTFMVGGDENIYNEVKYLFDIMGKNSILCGEIGAGQSAKICNNLLLASTMIAVGDSFNLGKKLGLDLNKLFEVISSSSGSCWAVNSYCPIKGIGPVTPADNDYKGGFSSALMYKDLTLAMDAAINSDTSLNYGHSTLEKFHKLVNDGKGQLDFSNIINE